MTKNDCFAIGFNARCAVTHNKDCKGCNFYKTRKQFKADFKAAKDKLKEYGKLQLYKDTYPLLAEMCRKI